MPLASEAERRRIHQLLHQIRRFVNGDLDVESDGWFDEHGDYYVPSFGEAINRCAWRVAELAEQIEKAAGDRARKDELRGQIAMLVDEHFEQLPERIRLASTTGLLDESMGAARAALLRAPQARLGVLGRRARTTRQPSARSA